MLNKKAALFHWMIFGVLAAIGLFFLLTADVDIGTKTKGDWHLSLLAVQLEAQEDLLNFDQQAKQAGREAIAQLSWKGSCGDLNNYYYWNKLDDWDCLPDPEAELINKIKTKLNHTNISLEGTRLIGKGATKNITKKDPYLIQYFYDTSFAVDLGVDIEGEYKKLQEQTLDLVGRCRNARLVESCVRQYKPQEWKFKDCKKDYKEENRVVQFCVESKQRLFVKGKQFPLNYLFALDFTPTTVFSVEETEGSYDNTNNLFEISFLENPAAERYLIYYTNYTLIEGQGGTPMELMTSIFPGYFWESKEISTILEEQDKCASGVTKQENTAYRCGDKIFYTLKDDTLAQGKEFLAGVTSISNNQESEITALIKIS